MKVRSLLYVLVSLSIGCRDSSNDSRTEIAQAMEASLVNESLAKWYPLSMDTIDGGFLSAFTDDFRPTDDQRTMIVTQARHTWTNAKAALRYPEVEHYKTGARHGYKFLRDFMWDKGLGGFFTLVSREGELQEQDPQET